MKLREMMTRKNKPRHAIDQADEDAILWNRSLPEPSYFGDCPACGRTDGYLNVRKDSYFVCTKHRLKWWAGSGQFSSWLDEDEKTWERHARQLASYLTVIPWHRDPARFEPVAEDISPATSTGASQEPKDDEKSYAIVVGEVEVTVIPDTDEWHSFEFKRIEKHEGARETTHRFGHYHLEDLARALIRAERFVGERELEGDPLPPPLPGEVQSALGQVLEYVYDDEERDYLAAKRSGHIFEAIRAVRCWLDRQEQERHAG